MKCLVTGNHGYIGFILSDALLKKGHDVVGYDCDYFTNECFGRKDAYELATQVPQITKDLRDCSPEDLRGIDIVFHLAALPNDPAGDLNPDVTDDINHLATLQLAILSKRAGVRKFIFASSCAVFGVKGDTIINENDRPSPITAYGVSKLNAELSLQRMNSSQFTVTIMRNGTCYGVSPRMRFDMVLNNLVGHAVTEGKVKVLSDGTAWRPLVHVEDVARTYILVAEADRNDVAQQVFAVGSENFRVKEIAEIVNKTVPDSTIEYLPSGQRDWRSYRVDFTKIQKVLGYRPRWTAARGSAEVYDASRAYGLDGQKFQDKKFWAEKTFRYLMETKSADPSLRKLPN